MAVATVAAAALGAGVQPAPARADGAYPELAGVTTVHTSTSGVATVRLSQQVTIVVGKHQFGPAGNSVVGDGRITAMFLEHNGHIVMGFIHVRPCATAGCSDRGFGFPWFVSSRTLAPGLYHLYVVADGAPVTATLSLDGLPGTTTIPVAPDQGISVQPFTPLLPSTGVADPALYSANAGGTIGAQGGLLLNSTWIDTASYVADYDDFCAAPGAPPPVYAAGCDLPSDPATVARQIVPYATCDPTSFCDPGFTADAALFGMGSFMAVLAMTAGPDAAGPWSQGRFFEGAAVLTGEGGNGLWLSFAPQERDASGAPAVRVEAPAPSASPTASPAAQPAAAPPAIGLPDTAVSAGPGAPVTVVAVAALLLVARRRGRRRAAGGDQAAP
jgi:hypothetical protein